MKILPLWLLMQYLMSASGSDTFYNVALFKPAFQSSVYKDWTPIKGNDGGTKFADLGGQCVHTSLLNNSWWMVDLLDSYVIKSVVLANRNDYLEASMRLRNFTIDVFNDDPRLVSTFPTVSGDICYNQTEPATNGTFTWNCSRPLVGRYVRIIMQTTEILNFCELQVMSPLSTQANEFKVYKNLKLNMASMFELTVSRSMMCVVECVMKRYTNGCTAFNWFPSTRLCQLLNIDMRVVNVEAQLIAAQDVIFYVVKY